MEMSSILILLIVKGNATMPNYDLYRFPMKSGLKEICINKKRTSLGHFQFLEIQCLSMYTLCLWVALTLDN